MTNSRIAAGCFLFGFMCAVAGNHWSDDGALINCVRMLVSGVFLAAVGVAFFGDQKR